VIAASAAASSHLGKEISNEPGDPFARIEADEVNAAFGKAEPEKP
jgi:hypothetical protein